MTNNNPLKQDVAYFYLINFKPQTFQKYFLAFSFPPLFSLNFEANQVNSV